MRGLAEARDNASHPCNSCEDDGGEARKVDGKMDQGADELSVGCQAMEQRILRLAEGQGLTPLDSGTVQDVAQRNEVKKVVVFADAHHKNTMEFPSSTAVAVEDGIIPHLTSNSVNCGMALVRTNLMAGDLREKELDTFYALVRASFPDGSCEPTITVPEVFEAITRGAQWALQRFELDEEQFAHVAQSNRPAYIPINECEVETLHEMSHDVLGESCYNFGAIGKSNHFIELQMVEDIVDRRVADLFNVNAGQLLIMYHGGGGAYCGMIGNLFVPRKKGSWQGKYYNLTRRKIPFHLFTARSGKQLRKRLSYYFFNRGFPHLPTFEEENRRLLTYDHFAMNYGYAYRIASLAMIQRALKQISGSIELSLLYDLPHNLITREVINGEEVYVHRHNAKPCVE